MDFHLHHHLHKNEKENKTFGENIVVLDRHYHYYFEFQNTCPNIKEKDHDEKNHIHCFILKFG